jgi:putative transposase
MARPLRIDVRNGWYHVTNRGNNRQIIYLDDRDRLHFLELFGEVVERYGVEVHGYVLMSNHYHVLIRTPDANLSAAVQWLNVAYSIWWNRRHGRSGHVFQGRFKAVLVEAGQWVLACSVYLHLNPVAIAALDLSKTQKAVEAKGWGDADASILAKRLEWLRGYRWSSYSAYAGYATAPTWLSTEELWKRAGGRDGYRKLTEDRLRQGQEEPLWSRLKWGLVLGGERFAEEARVLIKVNRESTERRALRQRGSWEQVVQAVAKARGEKWEKFAHRHGDAGLGMALYVARRCSGLTLRQLGESAGGMDYSAVAASIKRFEQRLKNESGLRVQTQALLKQI